MKNPFSLEGKNILITGASSGIGRQCAIFCSEMGANVILVARDEERLQGTLGQLRNGNHIYYSQDITDYEEMEPLIADAVLKLGEISGVVHSAGAEMTLPINMLKAQKFEEVYSINVIAPFNISRIVSKKKYIADSASFVFISSIMAQVGQPGKIGYCSSKGALVAGAKAMALELANKNIRVNSILPGMVKSEMSLGLLNMLSEEACADIESMHPLGLGRVEDVANACAYLLSDASKWITGTSLVVDGGYLAR